MIDIFVSKEGNSNWNDLNETQIDSSEMPMQTKKYLKLNLIKLRKVLKSCFGIRK